MKKDYLSTQISKQLKIYFLLSNHGRYSARELMLEAKIGNRRTLERYLCDIRNSGMLEIIYRSKLKGYRGKNISAEPCLDKKKAHMERFIRLSTFFNHLIPTEEYEVIDYLEGLVEKEEFVETIKGRDPKKIYYSLFPGSNERTRQRDFDEIRRAGYNLQYSYKLQSFILLMENRDDAPGDPEDFVSLDEVLI